MQRGAKSTSPLHGIHIVTKYYSDLGFFRIAGVCQPIALVCHRHTDSN